MSARAALTRQQSRAIDQVASEQFHIPGVILMENAGRGTAEILLDRQPRKVLICCGPGNNGGDGFVIARHLDLHQVPITIALFCPRQRLKGDALINFRIVEAAGLEILDCSGGTNWEPFDQALSEADWVVDALLGTGVTSPPREPVATAIRRISTAPARVLAVDVPSGLDCDTGQPHDPAIVADVTVTFVTTKAAYDRPEAQRMLGELHVVDIGTPRAVLEKALPPSPPAR